MYKRALDLRESAPICVKKFVLKAWQRTSLGARTTVWRYYPRETSSENYGRAICWIYSTTQIIVSDIARVSGHQDPAAKYSDRQRQSRDAGIPCQPGDQLLADERLKKTIAGYAI